MLKIHSTHPTPHGIRPMCFHPTSWFWHAEIADRWCRDLVWLHLCGSHNNSFDPKYVVGKQFQRHALDEFHEVSLDLIISIPYVKE